MFTLKNLNEPYYTFAETGNWEAYISALSKDGLKWWFHIDIAKLAAHLVPLLAVAENRNMPKRLIFLTQIINQQLSEDSLWSLYRIFSEQDDQEAAAAVTCTAVMIIFESGTRFTRLVHQIISSYPLFKQKKHPFSITNIINRLFKL